MLLRASLIYLAASCCIAMVSAGMAPIYQWKTVDFLWDTQEQREEAIKAGTFNFAQTVPMDVDKARDGRVFVSLTGAEGVPARLATVSSFMGPTGPLLKPYPDWSWFQYGNCDSIYSVYRIAIDECNRMWVLDTGIVEGSKKIASCPPKLLVFDLTTDKLVDKIVIPPHIAGNEEGSTLLSNPIVETNGPNCVDTTVYMADTFGAGLIVYHNNELKRFESPTFKADPKANNVSVGDVSIEFGGDILGLALSPAVFPGEPKFLYARPLASYDLFAISTNVLKNSPSGTKLKFLGAKDLLSSQSVVHVINKDGIIFFGLTKEMAIACYNRYNDLIPENIFIADQNPETLQYANGMKLIPRNWYKNPDEELWVLTNKFVQFNLGQLDANQYNFRILASPVPSLIANRPECMIPEKTKINFDEIYKPHGDLMFNN